MHNSSASHDMSTGNDAFNLPMNMSNHNTVLDEIFSHMTSVPPAQSNTCHLNSQKQIMAEFPGLSMLQGEPMNKTGFGISNHVGLLDCDALVPRNAPLGRNAVPRNLLERNNISYPSSVRRNALLERNVVPRNTPERNTISDPSCPVSNIRVQEQLMGGVPISASSLAAMLAARYGFSDNQKELGASAASVYTLENLKTSASNDYSEALNSAFATSLNCGYDGILGGVNNKWDFDKFVSCPDLAMKVPVRTGGSQSFELMGNISPNGWIPSDNPNVSSNVPSSSKFSNELSLSLAMCQPSIIHGTSIPDQNSEVSCSGFHSLNERQLRLETSCNSRSISTSFSSCRPVQLPQFLSGSRYLHVIQEILAELASYSLENLAQMNYYATRGIGAGTKLLPSSGHHANRCNAVVGSDDPCDGGDARFVVQMDLVQQGREVKAKRKQLFALLQVVDDRYNQCLDEIHTVISAFHSATELDPRLHSRFALQTISSLYKNLKERISTQILEMGANFNKGDTSEEDRSFQTSIQKQWALQQLRRKDQQLWRPQRGLPERSVSVLRAWMFQNFLHPYPKDAEKHLLAVRSGLTRSQVSNWFINARVRLWKPMIEEMCSEMNRRNGRMNDEERVGNLKAHESIESRRSNTNR